MRDAFLRAQSLYKRQKYRLALEILESNVQSHKLDDCPVTEQLSTLDLLAALCEKQGFLNRARKYAVRMIRLSGTDPRGYLRLGKILQLLPERHSEAIQIYQRALVKIDPLAPACRNFLERQLASCSQQKRKSRMPSPVSGTPCDPVERLPYELLVLVFEQLDLRERVRCTLVAKSWFTFLNKEPRFWTSLSFQGDSRDTTRYTVVSPSTIAKYCSRANALLPLQLDLQNVLVRDPTSVFKTLLASPDATARLSLLKFDNLTPVSEIPTIRMFRYASKLTPSPVYPVALRELRISSDTPESDVRWCLKNLPSLEVLDITTTPQIKTESHHSVAEVNTPNLHTFSVLGRCGKRVLSDQLAADVVAIPSLRKIDMHRVVPVFWPILHCAVSNPQLKRWGFTAEGNHSKTYFSPLPRFAGTLESLTLNDISLSCVAVAPLLPDGTRYMGGSRASFQYLTYLEMKRVTIAEFNLAELIFNWGCASTITTIVAHAFRSQSQSQYPCEGHLNFEVLPQLETLQLTGMGNVTDDVYEWIIAALPNLRKLNLDGTVITGPKLVSLLQRKPSLQFVRCRDVVDLSADTVTWIRNLSNVFVTF